MKKAEILKNIDMADINLKKHLGHIVFYNTNPTLSGKLIRVNLEKSPIDNEHLTHVLYIENKPFPIRIYADQLKKCECGKG